MSVFVKAVDLGSFAAAAVALDLSGPMVGKHVRFLEERLGMRLINRTTRRQSMTDFGRAYYERCRVILAETAAADALATDQLSEPRGTLRVTMPVHFGRHCAAPILLEMARQYPALELNLSFSDRVADLAEGTYDLAVRTGALADNAGTMARRLARQPMVACGSPAYLQEHGEPQRIEELAGHQTIAYRRSGPVSPWLFPCADQAVTEFAPSSRLRLDDLDAIADAAVAGLGLAWLPFWLVRDRIASGALVRLFPDQPQFLYDCHALWLEAPNLPRRIRLAIDTLAAKLPRYMA
jgi:DNA-binding transcriptional LysR family regulator